MNARSYRVSINLSPLDFPAIEGLGLQSDFTKTEPPVIVENKVVLKITRSFIISDSDTNKEHEVFTMLSIYQIPVNEIKAREDIYEIYRDTTLGLNEAYQFVKKQVPALPDLSIPTQSMDFYKTEIDGVFHLLNSRN